MANRRRNTTRDGGPSIASMAKEHPEEFDYLAAMRLVTLFALRAGGINHIEIRTVRGAAAAMHDVAALDLTEDPVVEFTFGLHSAANQLQLLDEASGQSPERRALADLLDRWIHLRRYSLWLSRAYPTLAHELKLAAEAHGSNDPTERFIFENPLQPLIDAMRLRTGLPEGSPADDDMLLTCAWAIVMRSAPAIEDVLSQRLAAPVMVLPPDGDANRIRLRIEVSDWEKYLRMLPLGTKQGLRDVVRLVKLIAGPQVEPELTLVLDRHALPGRHDAETAGYPEWTMFPVRPDGPPVRDPEVFVSAAHCRRAMQIEEPGETEAARKT